MRRLLFFVWERLFCLKCEREGICPVCGHMCICEEV